MNEFRIRPALRSDAPLIATAVMQAVGDEICLEFAGSPDNLKLVTEVFERLAADDAAQYSYRNSLIAEDSNGQAAGVIIAYDGAELHRLRKRFIEVANAVLGYDMKEADFIDETDSGEVYLDSIFVLPEYRGQGLAGMLINATIDNHKNLGKPAGLLVDPDNPRARRVYERMGFRQVGHRPFAGVMMEHMQKE